MNNNEVQVWSASLDRAGSQVTELSRVLTQDELDRAGRYRFQRDQDRFIVRRGLLRTILGRYLGEAPEGLRFGYGAHGKPRLADEFGNSRVSFNLSDSAGRAIYAVTPLRELGVDIERIDPAFATEEIAERFFSRSETRTLRALPEESQPEAFFACWTRKEAYIKAKGEGLSMPLDRFEVSLAPGEPAALLRTRGDENEAARWRMRSLPPPTPDFAAAICVAGHHWLLQYGEWPMDFLESYSEETGC